MTIELPIVLAKATNRLNQPFTFHVPDHVHSITITVQTEQQMWLTYMVYDEQQELRAQYLKGKSPNTIVINQDKFKTSPYTIYGPLPSGEWMIDLALITKEALASDHQVAKVTIQYNEEQKLIADKIFWQDKNSARFQLNDFDSKKIYPSKSKWYKGDFHTHTIYSDGQMTREENMISAKHQDLDFFVATDHNIVPTSWHEKQDILVIPGVEVTAQQGHFNVLATDTSPFSNNKLADMETEEGMKRIIQSDYGNAVISINHPFLTEWKWLFTETPLDQIDSIEICNDPTYPDNEKATEMALTAWNVLLNDGYRITGIGGSDSHLKPTETYEGSKLPSLIGDPGTFVYGEGLSADQIVKGLKQGNVVVSREAFIQYSIDSFISGDQCTVTEGTAKASVDTDTPIYFEWIVDGAIIKKEHGNQSEYTFNFSDQEYHWIRVDVRYEDGRFYGFSNPIYFNDKKPTITTWGQLLAITKEILPHD
ncbi:CehA/McbA family metallohydrolase [Oceanobacillus saliphilus]|uniref:CehA/McbA family metallohydrolase n=1 Tax=Oceanobacillus saliphilus TaxID=2925834 RepID=UPI00201E3609|nr:CehA/McbA family metallohydrolase [Oceanobacillus saliphilus]